LEIKNVTQSHSCPQNIKILQQNIKILHLQKYKNPSFTKKYKNPSFTKKYKNPSFTKKYKNPSFTKKYKNPSFTKYKIFHLQL
jgi:hypothetical protein